MRDVSARDGIANAVILATEFTNMPTRSALHDALKGARVLFVGLASFDGRPKAALYSLDLLFQTDFSVPLRRNNEWYDFLSEVDEPLTFEGDQTNLTGELGDPLSIITRLRLELDPGEWEAVGPFMEIAMLAQPGDVWQPFNLSGSLLVRGLAAARHIGMPKEYVSMHDETQDLIDDIADKLPLTLEVKDSRMVACWAGDDDIGPTLRRLSNEDYDSYFVEFAVGTNREIKPFVDWRINSQMNEGAGGLHLALGDGLTGAHIDFIGPHVRCVQGPQD